MGHAVLLRGSISCPFPFSHLSDAAASLSDRRVGLASPSGTLVDGKRSLLRQGWRAAVYLGEPSHLLCPGRKADSQARVGYKESDGMIQHNNTQFSAGHSL